MKHLLRLTAAVALPVGVLAATGGVAAAGNHKTDASQASITCTSVDGALKFAPGLVPGGTLPGNVNVKLLVSGCTVTGAPGVEIAFGTLSASLHIPNNDASLLLGSTAVSGSADIHWKTSAGKLAWPKSTVTVSTVVGAAAADGYGSITIAPGTASVAGDFAGTDAGASSSLYAESLDTVAQLGNRTTGKGGLNHITIGTGATHTTGNQLTLG